MYNDVQKNFWGQTGEFLKNLFKVVSWRCDGAEQQISNIAKGTT